MNTQISTGAHQHWDIFCRIVDNFGDIGVCWRLSRQLVTEHHVKVRLFIDKLDVASNIIPFLDCTLKKQTIHGVEILDWQNASQPAEVVLQTFSCELPAQYLANMQQSTWINLEYLSAEPWVEGFHARHSNNTQPVRHFFFPGFTDATGGLIRESDIFNKNQEFKNNNQLKDIFLTSMSTVNAHRRHALKVSLFYYAYAPMDKLIEAMATSNQAIDCYVPAHDISPHIVRLFEKENTSPQAGSSVRFEKLHMHIVPFLSQAEYDKLLTLCDINFVRGEDSWIRAIWAANPFIWLPYLQSENTHITKLNAFLDRFYELDDDPTKRSIVEMSRAWSTGNLTSQTWQNYLDHLTQIKALTLQQSSALTKQADLASKLVIFSKKLRVQKSRVKV